MAATVLGGTIEFMAQLGIYDIILPFLLVFTLMFATLEKTKLLGVEIIVDKSGKEHSYTRKNLNSIIAFTTAFFVIASAQLVRIISEVIANTMILLVTGLSFMLAVGLSHSGQDEFKLSKLGKGWEIGFWIANLVGIILIFLNAIGWLDKIYQFVTQGLKNPQTLSIFLILVFVGLMVWITSSPKNKPERSDD
ncbi:MAG: hypothetical protein KC535_00450 [Nanoarchaeota archaeon]|nr:hypothetical protein [Nanoarchaeota archaeon]